MTLIDYGVIQLLVRIYSDDLLGDRDRHDDRDGHTNRWSDHDVLSSQISLPYSVMKILRSLYYNQDDNICIL